jgi:hypothetical protein
MGWGCPMRWGRLCVGECGWCVVARAVPRAPQKSRAAPRALCCWRRSPSDGTGRGGGGRTPSGHFDRWRTWSHRIGSATPALRRKSRTGTSRNSPVSRKLGRPRASPTVPGGNGITPALSSRYRLVILATRTRSPRTASTRHGRSLPPGPSSNGTLAHQISDGRGRGTGPRPRSGRPGGRVRPPGRPERRGGRRDRPHPSTTVATSASDTTAASANHQDVSMATTVPAHTPQRPPPRTPSRPSPPPHPGTHAPRRPHHQPNR